MTPRHVNNIGFVMRMRGSICLACLRSFLLQVILPQHKRNCKCTFKIMNCTRPNWQFSSSKQRQVDGRSSYWTPAPYCTRYHGTYTVLQFKLQRMQRAEDWSSGLLHRWTDCVWQSAWKTQLHPTHWDQLHIHILAISFKSAIRV